jgi:hypothetical protein
MSETVLPKDPVCSDVRNELAIPFIEKELGLIVQSSGIGIDGRLDVRDLVFVKEKGTVKPVEVTEVLHRLWIKFHSDAIKRENRRCHYSKEQIFYLDVARVWSLEGHQMRKAAEHYGLPLQPAIWVLETACEGVQKLVDEKKLFNIPSVLATGGEFAYTCALPELLKSRGK